MFQYYKLFDYMRKNNIRQKDLLDKKIISNGTLQKLRNNENVNTFRMRHYRYSGIYSTNR